jgi:hypothetical protein
MYTLTHDFHFRNTILGCVNLVSLGVNLCLLAISALHTGEYEKIYCKYSHVSHKKSDVIKDGIYLKHLITPSKAPAEEVTLSHPQTSAMLVII